MEEEQVSRTEDNSEILGYESEDEEVQSAPLQDQPEYFATQGLTKLATSSGDHERVRLSFLECLGPYGYETEVVAVYENSSTSLNKWARSEAFRAFEQALCIKYAGEANTRMAWYCRGSKKEISGIVSYGFSRCSDEESHGVGVYLTPLRRLAIAAADIPVDEDGVAHIILCHVIMGNMEVIPAGSKQCQPSSVEFDSGVDNPSEPERYIVWNAYMNSHINPTFVISFRCNLLNGSDYAKLPPMGNTPILRTHAYIRVISKYLNSSKKNQLMQCYHEHSEDEKQLWKVMTSIVGNSPLMLAVARSGWQMIG